MTSFTHSFPFSAASSGKADFGRLNLHLLQRVADEAISWST